MCSELTHNICVLTHVFGKLICICSELTHVFGELICICSEPTHICGEPTHIVGELMPISSELNKIIYSTPTRSFGRFLQESVGHPKHEIVKNMKPVRMRM